MEYLRQPWAHQLEGINRAKDLDYFAFFYEQGTGKTLTAINTLRHKMVQAGNKYLRTLVFTPPVVIPQWKEEFLMNSKIPESKIILLNGSGAQRLKLFNATSTEACVYVTNYEALLMPELYAAFLKWKPEALIFDESQRLANMKAKRTKLAAVLANPKDSKKPFTYILSGTPVLNSPMDLFAQFLVLDGGVTFGKNEWMFRARFFFDKNAGMPAGRHFPDWRIKPNAIEEINGLIFRHGLRKTKEECLDLPDELSITVKCGMLPNQAKQYKDMKEDFVAYVGDQSASASLAIVKSLRLLQLTSGFLPLDSQGEEGDPAKVIYPGTPKEEALRELLLEIAPHSKIIIWTVFQVTYGVIRKVCEDLGLEYVECHGQISRSKQDANINTFKTSPSCRIFICHPCSGSVGLNLVVSNYTLTYSRTFSLENFLQARARIHRGGQTQRCTHYDLICEGTIDELVQKALAEKFKMSEDIMSQKAFVAGLASAMKEQRY